MSEFFPPWEMAYTVAPSKYPHGQWQLARVNPLPRPFRLLLRSSGSPLTSALRTRARYHPLAKEAQQEVWQGRAAGSQLGGSPLVSALLSASSWDHLAGCLPPARATNRSAGATGSGQEAASIVLRLPSGRRATSVALRCHCPMGRSLRSSAGTNGG